MITEKEIAEFFKLFSNDGRLKIITSLADKALTVSEIVDATQLSQSLVSQQLKLLKAARILTSEKQGKSVTYSIYDRHILHLLKDVAEHLSEQESAHENQK
ncbi:ArsR/SmtB family transcription factor [Lactococcus kimchii]|uniref:ArsR/SmtB family transcription factor n=1 Tax=Lactococcus sp. S-13 TaxID=2507158 RepID=UPI0010236F13|nr:metalloregulator ArsR/SmtB family transcription factor [Lactococcus sp. S-13]RZI48813.1 ArsR family transcriptional regulator [Lactococcus sp. S-13]